MDVLLAGMVIGAVAAGIVAGVLVWRAMRSTPGEAQKARDEQLAAMVEQMRMSFAALSREALSANTNDFLAVAKSRLDGQAAASAATLEEKKKLIDVRLEEMGVRLSSLNDVITAVEKQRMEMHGAMQKHLDTNTAATRQLQTTTGQLREALAHPQRRGQWGERMAEDVLRLAGFIEGVNYFKQEALEGGARPDFTFPLPGDRVVHMDVKFPLVNYLKVLDATDENVRAECTLQFLRDVRSRLKEVAGRDYIDPGHGTVDYTLVFIPNEQVYGFIHEHDGTLLDDAIRTKVVLCSPLTLYAILAVIRQAMESFRVEQGSQRILELLGEFQKQWVKFVDTMERMGRRLDDARKEYEEMAGTRARMLERQLDKIENLKARRDEGILDAVHQGQAPPRSDEENGSGGHEPPGHAQLRIFDDSRPERLAQGK